VRGLRSGEQFPTASQAEYPLNNANCLRKYARTNSLQPERSGYANRQRKSSRSHKEEFLACQLSSVSGVIAKPILGGLHHEYEWAAVA
jgi:hypothetical protein